MTEDNLVLVHAKRMADIFEDNFAYVDEEAHVTNEGLKELSDYFTGVDLELRAAVFEWFIVTLNTREIKYDVTQFGGHG